MRRWLKGMLSGIPLIITLVGVGLALWTGSVGWVLGGVCAAAIASAPRVFSRRGRLLEQVANVTGSPDEKRLADLQQLAGEISRIQGVPAAEQYGLQVKDQFEGASAKYVSFVELLRAKFDPGELTFARYLKSADQVYLSILDDIQNALTVLKGLQSVDVDQIRAQVRVLKRKGEPTDGEQRELLALEERLGLREQELASVRDILATNEQALTNLTVAGTALAKIQTKAGRTTLDSAVAMQELEELAARAEQYAISKQH